MRRFLGILCVAVFLLGPLHEWTHHHGPETRGSDCIACQFHHSAMEPPTAARLPEAPLPVRLETSVAVEQRGCAADPLLVAPKTSPPRAWRQASLSPQRD